MSTPTERRLEAAAQATDAVIATWSEPSAPSLATPTLAAPTLTAPPFAAPTRTARARSRRVLYPALSAAAVAAVVATAVVLTGSGSGSGPAPAAAHSAPNSSTAVTVAAAASDAPTRATAVLEGHVTGLRDVRSIWMKDGSFVITGAYWANGKQLAQIDLEVHRDVDAVASDPCVLPEGARAGHQGAPAPDDTCSSLPQPDGSVVWFWRMGHSASRPWTTAATKEWELSQVRAGGTVVTLDVSNMIGSRESGDPIYASVPFEIASDALVAVVTSPEVAFDGPCTRNCVTRTAPGAVPPTK